MEEFDRIDQDGHNPTVYGSYAEMKAVESSLPFDDPEPDDGCWNCRHYNGESCMKRWKNGDVAFYDPIMDDRDPDDYCEGWTKDKNANWEVHHGNNP